MYKKIMCIALCAMTILKAHIVIDSSILINCPSEYLIDIAQAFNDAHTTLLIGQQLYKNSYAPIIYEQFAGRFDATPPDAAYDQGTWIWIADHASAETGTWCFIDKTLPYYITYLATHTINAQILGQ